MKTTYEKFWNNMGAIHASILDADRANPNISRDDTAQIGIDMADVDDDYKAIYRKYAYQYGSFRMPNIAYMWNMERKEIEDVQ